jgi:two-component system, NarL family, response regulator NreC
MIKILIADDHNVFVEGIESLLTGTINLSISDHCCSINSVKSTMLQKAIDVILLDISFPRVEDGMILCDYILERYPKTKIIFLTMHDELSIVKRGIKKGVHGYLLKNTTKAELIEAINSVYSNKKYINSHIQELMDSNDIKNRKGTHYSMSEIKLSPREKEVLLLISEGYTNTQMASKLFVTSKAIEFHRSSLLVKFDVSNTALLIKTAIERNQI